MITVHKFGLDMVPEQQIPLPKYAQILSVADQRGQGHIWVMLDPDLPREPRTILIYGTGQEVDPGKIGAFIGTYQSGVFVYHVFEGVKR